MNGFHSALGTVTDAHWLDGGDDGIEIMIHYQFGGTVEVTDDVAVNGVTANHFNFIGGHNCRRKIAPGVTRKKAQSWLKCHYPRGKQEIVYFKPSNKAKCYTLADVNQNYDVGVSLLSILGGFCCLPLFYLLAHSASPGQHPVVTAIGALCLIIASPIILPFALIYCLLKACGCVKHGDDHPITQYQESVKENYLHASGKVTNVAKAASSKVGEEWWCIKHCHCSFFQ